MAVVVEAVVDETVVVDVMETVEVVRVVVASHTLLIRTYPLLHSAQPPVLLQPVQPALLPLLLQQLLPRQLPEAHSEDT